MPERAEQRGELGVELRLVARDRDPLRRRTSRRRRRSARRRRAGSCRGRRTRTPSRSSPTKTLICIAAPSTIAASITWPCPERSRSSSAARIAEREEEPTAAEVADEVDRRHRWAAGGADVREHAGERDVVDVVADVVGERPFLTPAGHAAVDEARVAVERDVRADAEPFGDAGPEALDQHVRGLAERAARSPRRGGASGRCPSSAGCGPGSRTATPGSSRCPRRPTWRDRVAAPRRRGRRAPCPRTASDRCSGSRARDTRRVDPSRRTLSVRGRIAAGCTRCRCPGKWAELHAARRRRNAVELGLLGQPTGDREHERHRTGDAVHGDGPDPRAGGVHEPRTGATTRSSLRAGRARGASRGSLPLDPYLARPTPQSRR